MVILRSPFGSGSRNKMPSGVYKRTHTLTNQNRKNISDAAKKGWENRSPVSQETKDKISIALKGMSTWMKGRKHTEETKCKMSETRKGINNAFYGKTHTDNVKNRLKQSRLRQIFPSRDSKPERFLQSILTLNSVKYSKHAPIMGQPDIFIEPNICIFVDGIYWHSSERAKKRDKEVNKFLKENNYIVLRFTDMEIYNNMSDVINKIMWVWKKN
jgi:G:T-mismatch repair DNA endonuclease (very short patch repair protein)